MAALFAGTETGAPRRARRPRANPTSERFIVPLPSSPAIAPARSGKPARRTIGPAAATPRRILCRPSGRTSAAAPASAAGGSRRAVIAVRVRGDRGCPAGADRGARGSPSVTTSIRRSLVLRQAQLAIQAVEQQPGRRTASSPACEARRAGRIRRTTVAAGLSSAARAAPRTRGRRRTPPARTTRTRSRGAAIGHRGLLDPAATRSMVSISASGEASVLPHRRHGRRRSETPRAQVSRVGDDGAVRFDRRAAEDRGEEQTDSDRREPERPGLPVEQTEPARDARPAAPPAARRRRAKVSSGGRPRSRTGTKR